MWGGRGVQKPLLPTCCSPTSHTFISQLPPQSILLLSPVNNLETQNTSLLLSCLILRCFLFSLCFQPCSSYVLLLKALATTFHDLSCNQHKKVSNFPISKPECFSPGVNFCFYVNPEVPKKARVSQLTSWFFVFESIFMLKK